MKNKRYIGPYGKKWHKAMVRGVGEVYNGQVVSVDDATAVKLNSSDWEDVEQACKYIKANGDICEAITEEGISYCTFHKNEIAELSELKRPAPKKKRK